MPDPDEPAIFGPEPRTGPECEECDAVLTAEEMELNDGVCGLCLDDDDDDDDSDLDVDSWLEEDDEDSDLWDDEDDLDDLGDEDSELNELGDDDDLDEDIAI
jgi:hypothetical protein